MAESYHNPQPGHFKRFLDRFTSNSESKADSRDMRPISDTYTIEGKHRTKIHAAYGNWPFLSGPIWGCKKTLMHFARCVFCYRSFFLPHRFTWDCDYSTKWNRFSIANNILHNITTQLKYYQRRVRDGSRRQREQAQARNILSRGRRLQSRRRQRQQQQQWSRSRRQRQQQGERYQLEEQQHQEQDHNQPQPRLRMPARFHDGEATEHGKSRWKNRVIHNRCLLFGEDTLESNDWSKWFGMNLAKMMWKAS